MRRVIQQSLAVLCSAGLGIGSVSVTAEEAQIAVSTSSGRTDDGNDWVIEVPQNWNGKLLLYSHGYQARYRPGNPAASPGGPELREALLERGYALAASSYSKYGWALEQAVPEQVALVDQFTQTYGKPEATIAWGCSMGGLVTTALAEQHPEAIDAAMPQSASVAGVLGLLNIALDAQFALKTLVDPDSKVRLGGIPSDEENREYQLALMDKAKSTPQGRARIALAAALAQLPGWNSRDQSEPGPHDYALQLENDIAGFDLGVWYPRYEQEVRAGGQVSWNTGVDYHSMALALPRLDYVREAYRVAGLSLEDDLDRLNAADRITGDARAVAYLKRHYTPTGRPQVPLLMLHSAADGMTTVAGVGDYEARSRELGATEMVSSAIVRETGHCDFSVPEYLSALAVLESRLAGGAWDTSAASLNSMASREGGTGGEFIAFRAPRVLRSCFSDGPCPGEPTR